MRRAVSTVPHRFQVSNDTRFLGIGQVRERYGVSDMWVYRHIRDHSFPKPITWQPDPARRWRPSEIEQWERDRARVNSGANNDRDTVGDRL
jgi:predicted DNA-binding transcriptional regulator AlpA